MDCINGFGTCMAMCSDAECQFRNAKGLVHPAEADIIGPLPKGTRRKHFQGNPAQMVKEYQRSAAGKSVSDPSELRPFPVLMRTARYLLEKIPVRFSSEEDWNLVFEFISDRLRAIRQDLIIQRLHCSSVISLMEEILPFYFVAQYRCETTKCSAYDAKLHRTQLEECLSRLMCAYRDVNDPIPTAKRLKFERVYLLYYLDDYMVTSDWLRRYSDGRDSLTLLIKDLLSAYMIANAVRFFRCVTKLISKENCQLEGLAIIRHFVSVRSRFHLAVLKAYRNQNDSVPMEQLADWLLLESTPSCKDKPVAPINQSKSIDQSFDFGLSNLRLQFDSLHLHS